MDFFEAQARAKKRTTRLVVLFVLAVLGTIAAAYFAALLGLHFLNAQPAAYSSSDYITSGSQPSSLNSQLLTLNFPLLATVSAATLAIIGLASLAKWAQFSAGGSAVAESVKARRVSPQTTDLSERRLLNVVEEMAIASGTPVPAVYILDDEPAINAFAAGLTTSDAVVAVTRGTLEKLNRDELQGVVAHEFSHILNGDMRLNLRLTALLFGILVLGLTGRGILWSLRYTRVPRSSGRNKNSGGIFAAIIFAGLALLLIGYIGYFFGRLIQAAVSRQREYLADASAVQFTRNPNGIAGALKKIGGYALGSRLQTSKAAAIGHFFFAQSFRSSFTGLWATHPPLADRIRAIDPNFDGQMFTPPEKIDVASESFVSAGLHPPKLQPKTQPPKLETFSAPAAIAAIGTLTPDQVTSAETLLASVPPSLRNAAHSEADAPILLYALLLADEPALRERERALVAQHAGPPALATLDRLAPELRSLHPEHKLPLVQLALPALRSLPRSALDPFLTTLDELVHADAHVSPFEYAVQKLVTRTLALGRSPKSATVQYHSFNALVREIATVLSTLAHASTTTEDEARTAFATGAAQLKLIEPQLALAASSSDLSTFDAALDKLAAASLPIKHRTLLAAAHVVSANGSVSVTEAELLRAIAAALDLPMPPLN
jgi:Zn-dependent protease with chaperone function